MGEVAERSEVGEGILPLPMGEVAEHCEVGKGILPLPMGEVTERSEVGEGKKAAIPSQSPAVTALPKGEPRDCTPLHRMLA